jgi:4-oxalomesaconate hydratase
MRRAESACAAQLLGAEICFFDSGDYPIRLSDETIHEIVVEYRTHQPEFVLTHSFLDPYNPDHPVANQVALQTRVYAQALGYPAEGAPLEAPPVFMFEPHQPEQSDFKPNVLLDITPVYQAKQKAMQSMEAQGHLVKYYDELALRRGVQAVRNSGNKSIKYAEAYQRVYPQVTHDLA